MTIGEILYSIIIMPLQLFFEAVFSIFSRGVSNPGMVIIALSLAMNMLVLPLYRRADKLQEEEREIEAKLRKGVEHIKKTFKGDEKMMMLQTYYRQNHYSPLSVFKNSLSLFLEIPFFIAAYNFLSHLELLNGVRFGIIPDLGAPDALLTIGGCSINVLPFVMTAINLVSCVIFTKGYPLKTKVQLYGMALFFMVFLYSSPAGLVFYWTLNNIFNLVKTILYKVENPRKWVYNIFIVFGIVLIGYAISRWLIFKNDQPAAIWGVLCIIPGVVYYYRRRKGVAVAEKPEREFDGKVYFSAAAFMAVLVGLVIPSAVIQASPQEFLDISNPYNPLWYVLQTGCLAAGGFVFWLGVFYQLTEKNNRGKADKLLCLLAVIAAVDYMFFGRKLGMIFNTLQFERGFHLSSAERLINAVVIILIGVVFVRLYDRIKKYIPQVMGIASLALFFMGVINVYGINTSLAQTTNFSKAEQKRSLPEYHFSKRGKNVVVLMLDRAMNEYIPYLFAEKPELKKLYAGFTYYPNTISFGAYTNFGTPALFGGYEYTPEEMNRRDSEKLVKKHNEALLLMPVLFDQAGFKVTVSDPVYAGYQWSPDLSIYDKYPRITKFISTGKFNDVKEIDIVKNNKRNFIFYSLMKTAPAYIQPYIYNDGFYLSNDADTGVQAIDNNCMAHGLRQGFLDSYNVLKNLGCQTRIDDSDLNTFLVMVNDTTHNPAMLQEPDYVPKKNVYNSSYEAEHQDRFTVDGRTIRMNNPRQVIHYQSHMAALLQIGKWLEVLKENGIYDNTRIIIVADHGRGLGLFDDMMVNDESNEYYNIEYYYPLLMVKDFDSKDLTASEDFMTNADVPTLAMRNLINKPVNPFTGKRVTDEEKYAHEQHVFASDIFRISDNNGNTFKPGVWFAVKDDMRRKENWRVVSDPVGK